MRSKKSKIALSIDTAGVRLGVAVHTWETGSRKGGGRIHCLRQTNRARPGRQSDFLIPTIRKILEDLRLPKRRLNVIGCNIGPGSFTGVRMGVATARALGQALDRPVVGACGLEIMAADAFRRYTASCVISVMPALAGELYFAVYGPGETGARQPKLLVAPEWRSFPEFKKRIQKFLKKKPVVIGERLENVKRDTGPLPGALWRFQPAFPSPDGLGRLIIEKFQDGRGTFRTDQLIPLYLQPSWAERKKNGK